MTLASEFLRPEQASQIFNISTKTLAYLRGTGNGPPFVKVGRMVMYDRRDFDAWLLARKVKSTSQVPDGAK